MNEKIIYIKHPDIDEKKWQRCIGNAVNSLLYANAWHLDRAAVVWDALVWGDYEYVMPLPVRRKWGFSYVYQPLFCQQLGIFPKPTNLIAEFFYHALIDKFSYCDVHLNAKNPEIQNDPIIKFYPRLNFLLSLKYNYKALAKNFSENTKRNISKAYNNKLQYIKGIRLDDYIEFKKANMIDKISKHDLERLNSIIAYGQYSGIGEIVGVYNSENELCAAVYFCRWKNRIIYLNAATSANGKHLRAMYFLIDNFIKAHAGHELVLDFEGSMIPGVARFYRGFGATPETYFQLQFNRLPLFVRWLKSN